MQINSIDKICGYPALEIRRLMRTCTADRFSLGVVAFQLQISKAEASILISALCVDGLIDQVRNPDACGTSYLMENERQDDAKYQLTIKGRALGMATAAKPIKRATAQRLVSGFLQRVEDVNNDPDLLYWVDEVIVFGSFLTESSTLGDVDFAVRFGWKLGDEPLWNPSTIKRVHEAELKGRYFPRFIDELCWSSYEIQLRLRNRSRSLHIHDLAVEGTFIQTLRHRRIYVRQPEGSGTALDITAKPSADSLNSHQVTLS
jgi:hypothetical protein